MVGHRKCKATLEEIVFPRSRSLKSGILVQSGGCIDEEMLGDERRNGRASSAV